MRYPIGCGMLRCGSGREVSRIFWILTGVPFLPEDAIPGRKGGVANFREDFHKYFSESASEM